MNGPSRRAEAGRIRPEAQRRRSLAGVYGGDVMEIERIQIIDLHVHLFPERMFEAVWQQFTSRGWGFHREYVPQIKQTLRAHGVTHAVGLSYPHKSGVAKPLNGFMETLGASESMFLPFASVYPDDPDFREIVDHALDSPHLHGFKFQPLVQRFDINHVRLDYLYEKCLERDFPITMHIGSGPVANEFVGIDHFRKLMRRFERLRAMQMLEDGIPRACRDDSKWDGDGFVRTAHAVGRVAFKFDGVLGVGVLGKNEVAHSEVVGTLEKLGDGLGNAADPRAG